MGGEWGGWLGQVVVAGIYDGVRDVRARFAKVMLQNLGHGWGKCCGISPARLLS